MDLHTCVCTCEKARAWHRLSALISLRLLVVVETGSLIEPSVHWLDRLTGQWAPLGFSCLSTRRFKCTYLTFPCICMLAQAVTLWTEPSPHREPLLITQSCKPTGEEPDLDKPLAVNYRTSCDPASKLNSSLTFLLCSQSHLLRFPCHLCVAFVWLGS